ncbi:MAG: nuclear transport factor 2 family protein [Frankiaceae bacterium]|nr:nuclear transport factor 2 family protein [Frankiaceae bacterium]
MRGLVTVVAAKSFAEVAEGVKATIAAYVLALDDGRTDDVLATFCSDGSADIPGLGSHRGHEELRAAYDAVKPQAPQRHLVLNTLVTEWSDNEAKATSDVLFLMPMAGRWSVLLVGRYTDELHCKDDAWRFHSRKAEWLET